MSVRVKKIDLSVRDSQVLSVIERSANVSVSDLAKALSMRPHIVRASLDRLKAHGAIELYYPINTAALGFTEYHISLFGSGLLDQKVRALFADIVANDRVPLVIEYLGELQFSVWARGPGDVREVLDELLAGLPSSLSRTLSIRRFFYGFGFALDIRRIDSEYVLIAPKGARSIDETDHKILRHISRADFKNLTEVARHLPLPLSTLEYRLRRMQKESILLEPRYTVNVKRLGLSRWVLRLKAKHAARSRDSLLSLGRRISAVVSVAEVLGSWDFEVSIVGSDVDSAVEATHKIVAEVEGKCEVVQCLPIKQFLKIQNYPFKHRHE
jgi:DNA-binding Lrp family transcriptional regulator